MIWSEISHSKSLGASHGVKLLPREKLVCSSVFCDNIIGKVNYFQFQLLKTFKFVAKLFNNGLQMVRTCILLFLQPKNTNRPFHLVEKVVLNK